ncbi:hypothetical protein ENVG_00299 [Emiliania huxleyi virus 84]|nr:hypothetical protein ENVG_00299 [Emiliania huxleyi virus 84]
MSDTSYVKKVTFNTENLPPIPPLVRQDATFFEPPPIVHKRTRSDTQQIQSILKKVGKEWLPVDETSSLNA